MKWLSELSGNPRTKFSGFENGRHGTEIFGPHPELVDQIVAFLDDALVTSPVDLKKPATPRKTRASEFYALVNQPGGPAKAVTLFRRTPTRYWRYGGAGIRTVLAQRKYNGSADPGWSGLQENPQVCGRDGPAGRGGGTAELEHEQAVEKRQSDWLKRNKIE
jgi:hypothetical protein